MVAALRLAIALNRHIDTIAARRTVSYLFDGGMQHIDAQISASVLFHAHQLPFLLQLFAKRHELSVPIQDDPTEHITLYLKRRTHSFEVGNVLEEVLVTIAVLELIRSKPGIGLCIVAAKVQNKVNQSLTRLNLTHRITDTNNYK